MAQIFPTITSIQKEVFRRTNPSDSEIRLLKFFENNLDDSYEVFFQPFINGLTPTFAILKEGSGHLIINYYEELPKEIHPQKLFEHQKFELANLIFDSNFFKDKRKSILVTIQGSCIINKNKSEFEAQFEDDKYFKHFSNKTLDNKIFNRFLYDIYFNRDSKFFDYDVYNRIRRYLKPSLHKAEEGKPFNSNEKQSIILERERKRMKISGVAGSGKTTVLAHKAVKENKKKKSKVLILCFNITMRKYIEHKLNEVQEDFYWEDFHISHYHDFFKNNAIQYKGKKPQIGDWEKFDLFSNVKEALPKYDTILIDEIQDYKRVWIDIIFEYFTHDKTDILVIGDDKQDIYQRKSMKDIPIRGRPNELNTSYRLSEKITNLCKKFYNTFLAKEDEIFEIAPEQIQIDFKEYIERITYKYIPSGKFDEIYNYIMNRIVNDQISPEDIAIISTNIDYIRELEYFFRIKKGEKTTRMFESEEEYKELITKHEGTESINFKINLDKIRRNYKLHSFNLRTGYMKFSSIHSFKGWEIQTIFLILYERKNVFPNLGMEVDDEFVTEEMVYTGITRARQNLNIINIDLNKYHNFFLENIKEKY